MKQNSELDFTGQEFYIGIDVHKKNWTSTIRSKQMELKTFSMNPSPEDLYRYMKRNYPNGRYISAYEAGFCGFWIHHKLEQLGFNNLVIHAADVPTTHKEKTTKADKVDSRKIARGIRESFVRGNLYSR